MSQGAPVRSGVNYQLLLTDSGVIMTAVGTTASLPVGVSALTAGQVYWVKNASTGIVAVFSATGLIDGFTGGLNGNSDSLDPDTAGAYVCDPDGSYVNWIKI